MQVLYIWAVTLASLFVVALLWYSMNGAVTGIYTSLAADYPDEMSSPAVTFLSAIWDNWPILAIFGLGVWVYVQAQKKPRET